MKLPKTNTPKQPLKSKKGNGTGDPGAGTQAVLY